MSDKLVNFNAPEETVKKAKSKLEHGEMSERLRATLKEIAHGTDVAEQTRIKDHIQQLREDRRDVEGQINSLQRERDEIDRKIGRLEERLDTLMDQQGEYEGFLQSIEQDLHDGKSVFIGHGKIETAADLGDCTQEEVIEALQERNPDLPPERFEQGTVHTTR